MTDEKKTDGWAKSLKKAGFLENSDEDWDLTDDPSQISGRILVEDMSSKSTSVPPADIPSESEQPLIIETSKPDQMRDDVTKRVTVAKTTDPLPPYDEENIHIVMKERFAVGDYSGALVLADKALETNPDDKEASRCRKKCRKTLMQMYESRIGTFDRAPVRAVSEEEIVWRNLDPISGFIATTVDGFVTFEDIIDISPVSRFATCKILDKLLQDGIIK